MRSLFRLAAGPLGRRSLILLLVAGMWAWWLWGPVLPASRWECPDRCYDRFELAPDGLTIVHHPLTWTTSHGPASRSRDCPVQLCDAATGHERFNLFADDLDAPGILGFAPDGSWLVVEEGDKKGRSVCVLALADGRELARFPGARQGEDWTSWGVWIIPDNRRLALRAPGQDEVKLWNVAAGRIEHVLPDVFPAVFSPDGRFFAVLDRDDRPGVAERERRPTVAVWDLENRREIARQVVATFDTLTLEFSPNGRRLAWYWRWLPPNTWPQRTLGAVSVWDINEGAPPVTVVDYRNSPKYCSIQFSPDGNQVVLDLPAGPQLWDLSNGRPRLRDLTGRGLQFFGGPGFEFFGTPFKTRFLPDDGRLIMCGAGSTTVELLAIDDLDHRVVCRLHQVDPLPQFAASRDGGTLAVSIGQATQLRSKMDVLLNRYLGIPKVVPSRHLIQLFDTRTGQQLTAIWQPEGTHLLGFSRDGQMLWTESRIADPNPQVIEGTRVICGWSVPTGRPPAWLVVVSGIGLLAVAWDWRRGRKRPQSREQLPIEGAPA